MAVQTTFLEAVHERDRILAAFAESHPTYLKAVRAFAREIALRNEIVTIDDLRTELARQNFPMPKEIGVDERILGAVFRCKDFVAVGQRTTTRAKWAARIGVNRSAVTVYKLREAA